MPSVPESVVGAVALAAIALASLLVQTLASFVKLSAKERAEERATRKIETDAQNALTKLVGDLKDQYVDMLLKGRIGG